MAGKFTTYVNDTHDALTIGLQTDDSVAFPLTGLVTTNITITMTSGDTTLTRNPDLIVSAAGGTIRIDPAAAIINAKRTWHMRVVVVFPTTQKTFVVEGIWEVL